jgi:hypothetical protein
MPNNPTKRGGRRTPAGGRPRITEEKLEKVSVTLDKTTLTTLRAISNNLSEAIRILATTKGETQ